MYPDLSYLLHDLFGTPVDNWTSVFKTFGLLLVMAILSAAWILYSELKRKAAEGKFQPEKVAVTEGLPATRSELISNAIFGFILGFKLVYIIAYFPEFQKDPSGVLLSMKGNWPAGIIGAVLFAAYKYWEGQKRKLPQPKAKVLDVYPHDRIGDITIIAAISGVIGSKVFDILEHPQDFINDPIGTMLSGSGLAIYGGLVFGFIGVYWYVRRKNIPFIHILDAVAPALIIAYGVGRLGCHFAGDGDWGIVNQAAQPSWWFLPDWLWAYDYPHNVINEGVRMEECDVRYCFHLDPPVFPTPLYETIFAFIIGGILWGLRKRISIPGMLFFLYLIFNGLERFWIEKIRVNQVYHYFGMEFTQAEFVSVILFVIGVVGCVVLWKKERKV